MSGASNKKATAEVAAAAADPTPFVPPAPKRKRATVKKEPAPKAAPAAPVDPRVRVFVCTDHPVLFGGRPGIAVCARDEGQARDRTIAELGRRGIVVKGKSTFRELGSGEVFMFQ